MQSYHDTILCRVSMPPHAKAQVQSCHPQLNRYANNLLRAAENTEHALHTETRCRTCEVVCNDGYCAGYAFTIRCKLQETTDHVK